MKKRKARNPKVRPLTMKTIMDKCSIGDGDCWIWKGALTRGGDMKRQYPQESRSFVKAHGLESGMVRRISLSIKTKNPVPKNLRVITTCKNDLCVNPDHLISVSRSEMAKTMIEQGLIHTPSSKAKMQKTAIEKRGRLSIEKAREIRASDESPDELAARYDVPKHIIMLVLKGKTYKDFMAFNPWQGLGQRAKR